MIRAFLVLSYVGKDWPGGQTAYIVDKDVYEFVRHPPFSGAIRCFGQVLDSGRSLGLVMLSFLLGLAFAVWAVVVEEPRLLSDFGGML